MEGLPSALAFVVEEEDVLPVVAAPRYVMRAARNDDSGHSRHGDDAAARAGRSQESTQKLAEAGDCLLSKATNASAPRN